MRPLGTVQRGCLDALFQHRSWRENGVLSGWVWGTPSQTEKALDSLVKRGLVVKTGDKYTLSKVGSELLVDLCKTHYPDNSGKCVYCGHNTNLS